MKTKYVLIGLFLLTTIGLYAQKGIVNKGAKIIITSNAYMNIDGGTDADYTNKSYDVSTHGKIDLVGKIKLEGDWQNQATSGNVFINTATDGEIVFDGTAQQTIGGTASTYFEKFTLNNSAGVRLNYATTIKGTLTLTSGLLKIGTNNLLLDATTDIAGSPSATAMIVANNTGSVFKYLTTTGAFTFPVGDTLSVTEYSPFSLTFNSGTFGAGAYVKLNVTNDKHPNIVGATDYLKRYWTVTPYNISSYNVNVAGYYTDADIVGTEGNIYMAKYGEPYWDRLDVTNTSLNKLTGTSLTSLSDFTGAESAAVTPSIALTYDGSITEGSENGEVITITLTNDDFVPSLNTANWTVTNLPQGVSKGTLTRTGNKTATITLSGNRTKDYDSNIDNVTVTIAAGELVHNSSSSISKSSGVTITAVNDAESITMTDDGLITEGSENGEIITVTAVGGTFANPLTAANWTLTNLPTGVTKGAVTWINTTTAQIALSGNRTGDYSSNITNVTLTITEAEMDEYTGADLSVATGVTLTAVDESLIITMASDGLISEGFENGELITVTISGKTFAASLNTANWTLTNLPVGVTKGTLTRTGATTATIALVGNRTKDYDANITNLSVQIASGEIDLFTPVAYITSGVTFTANNDTESIALSDNGITEGAENGRKIIVTLTGGTYASSLSLPSWTITNLPVGVSVSSINRVSSLVAELTLSGNRLRDFDTNITNVTVSAASGQIDDHTGSSISMYTGVTIVATNDTEVLSMDDDGSITEGHENGEVITVTLTGGTIADPIIAANWVLTNLPTGVSANPAVRQSATSVSFTLSGNTTQDYDADIVNTTLTVSAGQIYDNLSSVMTINSGVTFIATDEPVILTLTDDGISEGSENGKIITATITQDAFVSSLNSNNWTLTNLPQGVTKGAINRVSANIVTITLSGNRTKDYDTDITNVALTIAGAELTQHTSSPITQNTGLLFDAVDDGELLTIADDGQILEGSENGEVITVNLSGGTFAGSITPLNWLLTGMPNGVNIGSVIKTGITTVEITLTGNSTSDYDLDITNSILSVNEAEIDDYTGDPLTANTGITFTAIIEPLVITMADDGNISESNENNEKIQVTISNDVFAASLNSNNWIISNAPIGVSIGSVERKSATSAEITLLGNRTKDYDIDITASLLIAKEEFANQSSNVTVNSGVTFKALIDDESIAITDNGDIVEGSENGKKITATITGGTFSDNPNKANWIASNLPTGVSIGSVFKVDATKVEITLAGNREVDYDADILNFALSVNEIEIDDYTGSNMNATGIVTFHAKVEELTISHAGLIETNLNGAEIGITLTNESFTDAAFDNYNFTLNNAPTGVSINYIQYSDATHAKLYLYYTGTDFDTDISNFNITIKENEIQGVADLVSNNLPITAIVEDIEVTMFDQGIFEGQENGAIIYVKVKEDQFVGSLTASNWVLSNLPEGVAKGTISRISDDTVAIALTGNRTKDFDSDITNVTLEIASDEFVNNILPVTINSGVIIYALNDAEIISISDNGINEGAENGEIIYVKLVGGTFASVLNPANWALSQLPLGVTIGTVTRCDSDSVQIALSGNATIDYDNNITNMQLSIDEQEIDDYTGSDFMVSSGVVFIALNDDEVLSMADDGNISEGAENGELIEVTLSGGTFAPVLDIAKWNTVNLPTGVSLGSINRVSSHKAILTLLGNRTVDYDADITNFTLIINGNQVDDFSGSTIELCTGVTFRAKNELATISHSGLNEDNLNGARINLALSNETFIDSQLNKNNFGLFGLPIGASIDSVEYVSASQAKLWIGFDGTDFDTDHNNVYLSIDKSELTGNINLLSNSLAITAINDDEFVSMTDDGSITEGNEEGEQISITLTGGTFTNPLQPSNWSLFNAPLGVTLGSLIRNSSTSVTLVLSGNTIQDYDADITDFTVQIQPSEVFDYQGSAILLSSGVIFIANNEQLTISHAGLTESNLNGAVIGMTLSEESFFDAPLSNSSFTFNNAPVGLSVSSVTYLTPTTASLVLSFDGTDFDVDVTDFTITVNATELNGVGDLTSNSLLITAIIESQTALISHPGLTEENLNNAVIAFELKNEHFSDAVLNAANFVLSGAPAGTSISSVEYLNDSMASVSIAFAGYDFDSDFSNFRISVYKSEIVGTSGVTSNALTITATNDTEVLSMESDGYIEEGSEDGEIITMRITGGTFAINPLLENWSFFNLPIGVSTTNLIRIDNHTITIGLLGNATVDYDQNITNLEVQVDESEVDDYLGTPLIISSGIVFTAIVEPDLKQLTIADIGLNEDNLYGAVLTANITADYLSDNLVDVQNIKLLNAPIGLSINTVTVIDSSKFTVELAFDGSDFDADYSNFMIKILGSELHGGSDLSSNKLLIHAIIEAQQIFIADPGLTESNLNNSVIQLAVIGDAFIDNVLNVSNFKLSNAPDTCSIFGVTYINDTAALVSISFDGTDFDTNITDFGIIVLGSEFASGKSIRSNDLTIIALNDEEVISMNDDGQITEHQIEGEIVTVTITGGNFVANLNPTKWNFTNAPQGLTIRSVQRVNDFNVLLELGDDGISDFDSDITDLTLSVAADEINDHQSTPVEVSSGITLHAVIESVSIAHSGLTEENLNGAIITINLSNESFADNILDAANFTINVAGIQVLLEQATFISSTSAELKLSFDGTDFDTDKVLRILVNGDELSYSQPLESNALPIIATNDEEIFTMGDDGQILEGSENGEVITLLLTGGTFIGSPDFGSWTFENLPVGVTVGTVQKIDHHKIEFVLQGNATVDYDTNLTQFSVLIGAFDFKDYSGPDVLVKGGVTFTAILENSNLTIGHAGLNENNLNGAVISLVLTDAFFDNTQNGNISGITLNNVPDGLSVSDFQIESETTANLTLSYLGFDFDTDFPIFSITLDPNMLIPQTLLTSNSLSIQASIEPLLIVSYDGQINEGAEDGEIITITLAEGTLVGTFSIGNLNLSSLPVGISLSNLEVMSDKTCTFKLSGNRTSDYDADIGPIICNLDSSVFQAYLGADVSVETDIIFSAFNESLTISHAGLSEANLNGAVIPMLLIDDIFIDESLSPSNFTLYNAPKGTSISQINYLNNTEASLTLAFDGTDFTSDIPDFFVEVNHAELYSIENLQSNYLSISEGVGIFDDQSTWNLNIFANLASVFVTIDNLPNNWESATITIYDTKGTRVHYSDLQYLKVNKFNLSVLSGYYLVLVKINGIEFVNKVFILPE